MSRVYFDDVTCVAESDRSILVEIGDEQVWLPKSQVDEDSEVFKKDDEGRLVVTKWIAQERELQGEDYDS